jgi:hypothetical protein
MILGAERGEIQMGNMAGSVKKILGWAVDASWDALRLKAR